MISSLIREALKALMKATDENTVFALLKKFGATVPLAPDGPNKQARDGLKVAAQAIDANKVFLAISFPTAQQSAAQTKELTKQMNAVLRRLLLILKELGKD
jgi:hypothetical protein